MNPELSPKLPGYNVVYKQPSAEELRRPEGVLSRTAKYIPFLRERVPDKARLNAAILDYQEEPIDSEELERAPLFEFGKGFTGDPPAVYREGQEPAYAPISREKMRLLLVRVLPPPMVSFALEHLVFDYEPVEDQNDTPPGPKVKIKNDKVHITFYRNNFVTPPLLKKVRDREGRQLARAMIGFIDPRKISIFLGKIIAKMMPQPEEWPALAGQLDKQSAKSLLQAQKSFRITEAKLSQKKAQKRQPPSERQKQLLQDQWEDYVALAITNPELAKQKSPVAFAYFEQEAERFSDVTTDKKALDTLRKQANEQGEIQLVDFAIVEDISDEEYKLGEKAIKPEMTDFDLIASKVNRFLALFGQRITYTMPEDPDRARLMAKNDEIIKNIVETTDQEERDYEFGAILQHAKDFDLKARYQAFNYLLATSQSGEFAEWRVYAWLYKFSRKFRETNGREVSENDYKDLYMVHDQSDKAGRLGTSVMPYEKIAFRPPKHMEARYHGRTLYLYVRRDRAKYLQEIEKKIKAKNPSAIFEAMPGVIKQFENDTDFNAVFGDTPEGLVTQTGPMAEFLGGPLAANVGQMLAKMQVDKITPDAKALAIAYFDAYKSISRHYQEKLNRDHFEILSRYAQHLNRPAQAEVENLLKIKAKEVAMHDDVAYISERVKSAIDAEAKLQHTLGVELNERSTLSPDIQAYLLDEVKQYRITDPALLTIRLASPGGPIDRLFGLKTIEGEQERRNLISTLFTRNMRQTLSLLKEVQRYQEEARPAYINSILGATEQLGSDQNKGLLPEAMKAEELEYYQKLGIRLTAEDQRAITEAASIIDTSGLVEGKDLVTGQEDTEGKAEAQRILETENENAKAQKRAEIVRQRIQEAPAAVREEIVIDQVSRALEDLEKYFTATGLQMESYEKRYTAWLKRNGRIFKAATMAKVAQDLFGAAKLMDRSIRDGLELKHQVIADLNKSLHYEKELAKLSKETREVKKPETPVEPTAG